MIDIRTEIAVAFTTLIVPEAIKKIGENIGDIGFKSGGKLIKMTYEMVRSKPKSTYTEGLLIRVEEKPTASNIQLLQAELVSQMKNDQGFADRLEELIKQIQAEVPSLQVILDEIQITGNIELGNVEQISEVKGTNQILGRNLDVGGDLKFGDVTQDSRSNK
jgi:translation elongation factor EF-1beta